jgi:PPOX class probable F420-dependent enzyme
MARPMDDAEWRAFVSEGTRTGKLATVRKDGRPHVAPIWFVLDGEDVVFMTGAGTVKGRNLRRTGHASLCVDDERPPFSFVTISGTVALSDDHEAMLPLSIAIARRYMGDELAEAYGRRNAVPGEMLVRLQPAHVLAEAGIAD